MLTANVKYWFSFFSTILEHIFFFKQNLLAREVMTFSPGVSLADFTASLNFYSPVVLSEGKLMRQYRWYLLQRQKKILSLCAKYSSTPPPVESIYNHSGILICPPDILFAESRPWRGLGLKRACTIIELAKDHTQVLISMQTWRRRSRRLTAGSGRWETNWKRGEEEDKRRGHSYMESMTKQGQSTPI